MVLYSLPAYLSIASETLPPEHVQIVPIVGVPTLFEGKHPLRTGTTAPLRVARRRSRCRPPARAGSTAVGPAAARRTGRTCTAQAGSPAPRRAATDGSGLRPAAPPPPCVTAQRLQRGKASSTHR